MRKIFPVAFTALFFAGACLGADLEPGKLRINGVLQVSGIYNHLAARKGKGPDSSASRIAVSSVEVDLEAKVAERVTALAVLAWNDTLNTAEFDEASIDCQFEQFQIKVGRMYLPFGDFSSDLVSHTMPQFLGESRETAVLGAVSPVGWLTFGAFAFGGEAKRVKALGVPGSDKINDYGFMLTVTPMKGLIFGGSFISDLADSDVQITVNKNYVRRVAGGDLFARYSGGPLRVGVEVLGALSEFDIRDIAGAKKDSRPITWHVEAACDAPLNLTFAATVEGSREWYEAPVVRAGGAANWQATGNISLAAEYLNSLYDKNFSKKLHRDDAVIVQLAANF